jgi:hypothetical protein
MKKIANWLNENCSTRKEPQIFGIDAYSLWTRVKWVFLLPMEMKIITLLTTVVT